jgi:hypothetical protein
MKLIWIIGPQAVGKMTVGEELTKITKLKLFHNHMTIDLVINFFDFGSEAAKRLISLFREEIFHEVAKSDLEGLIFTFVWAFDLDSELEYIDKICKIFEDKGGTCYFIELEADLKERIKRNKTENRLNKKPSKRNIKRSEKDLLETMEQYRLNSFEGEIKKENYIKINNTNLLPEEVAKIIKDKFNL